MVEQVLYRCPRPNVTRCEMISNTKQSQNYMASLRLQFRARSHHICFGCFVLWLYLKNGDIFEVACWNQQNCQSYVTDNHNSSHGSTLNFTNMFDYVLVFPKSSHMNLI